MFLGWFPGLCRSQRRGRECMFVNYETGTTKHLQSSLFVKILA